MVEPLLDHAFEDFRDWADKYISRKARARIFWTVSIISLFAASFLAFKDENSRAESAEKTAVERRVEIEGVDGKSGLKADVERLKVELKEAKELYKKEKADRLPKIVAGPPPDSGAQRTVPDPDGLYQNDVLVGKVKAADELPSRGIVTFGEIYDDGNLNWDAKVTYRGKKFKCKLPSSGLPNPYNHEGTYGLELAPGMPPRSSVFRKVTCAYRDD